MTLSSIDQTLSAKNLVKSYGKRRVVSDVSFNLQTGEVVGILGPNGAGKTTCFYMVAGLTMADSGQIFLAGHDITYKPIYQRARLGLGYLPQEASVFRKLSVAENIAAILELNGLRKSALAQRCDELLHELGIEHIRHALGAALSGGERRRVEIARTLANNPGFILFDEPFAGVDPIAVYDIQKTITFLRDKGIGVLITDHNVRETLRICDHAYIVAEGRVIASGTTADIVAHEAVREHYLGEQFTF